jgi:hypothetical protein
VETGRAVIVMQALRLVDASISQEASLAVDGSRFRRGVAGRNGL